MSRQPRAKHIGPLTSSCTMRAVGTPFSSRMKAYYVVQRRTTCELRWYELSVHFRFSSQAHLKRQARCDRVARLEPWHNQTAIHDGVRADLAHHRHVRKRHLVSSFWSASHHTVAAVDLPGRRTRFSGGRARAGRQATARPVASRSSRER